MSNDMNLTNTLTCADHESLRSWLQEHHDKETEIWLIFFKKHTGVTSVTYSEALDEALCFGWIDGILRKIDEEKYARRFTPRKQGSSWSAANIARVRRLIDDDRMTEAGLRVFDPSLFDRPAPVNPGRTQQGLPEWMLAVFNRNAAAWNNFKALPPSQQRLYIGWILHAKKRETQRRRLDEAIGQLERNQRLGMK
jgi:uncharacterized protein YdeI (YjbR/CyaY-like superfamily)